MSRHDRYLKRAMAAAETSEHPRWRLGAVLVRGSSIISVATNVPRNDPNLTSGGPGTTWHAEISALRKLTYQADRAEGATLYVARVGRSGNIRLARPCVNCWKAVQLASVRSIFYTTDIDGQYGFERLP
jgi:tRNA(Arg) A34 adenosine deaminase TadA